MRLLWGFFSGSYHAKIYLGYDDHKQSLFPCMWWLCQLIYNYIRPWKYFMSLIWIWAVSSCIWKDEHYGDVIMTMLAFQITSLTVVYSIVYWGVNQRKHQSSASLAFVREIHRGPVNFPHKWPVTRKMFPFDDVIMKNGYHTHNIPRNVPTFWLWFVTGALCSTKLVPCMLGVCPVIWSFI